ncbi:hypothetical protein EC973_003300 [Apophysomyces ossiformis]|uniref:Catabolite repression protein creC n=1 Tax=Apophysomyces ossiformis TaxID=679940 RepID=A0A8H7ETS2_9FUNG|nr:hypothetical protein EC973_003300 [Apophysomyces ossiformis]
MDAHFHSTLASHGLSQSYARPFTNTQQFSKLLPPHPPTNKAFKRTEFRTSDGTYRLLNEVYLESIPPHYNSGTHASIINVQYGQQQLPLPSKKTSSTSSSMSETLATTISSSEKVDNGVADSSEDEQGIVFGNSHHIIKSAALPIPNSSRYPSQRSVATSSSSSSVEPGIHVSTPTPKSYQLQSSPSTASFPASLNSSTHINGSFASTQELPGLTAHTLSLENVREEMSSSFGGSNSVGSLSSLFTRTHRHHYPRKPKNSLTKTNSSFVLRIITHDQLAKKLASRTNDDAFLFYNVGTSFVWMDASSKPKEPLSRIVFTKAYITSHDVNMTTRSNDHLDVVIGFSTGDCVWYDPMSSKYFRLNKCGVMNDSAVTMVKWIPGSEDLFMVAFSDGSILILDKEREDQSFTSPPPGSWGEQQFQSTRPHKNSKYNPVSHWRISEKGVSGKSEATGIGMFLTPSSGSAFSFSPDGCHVAIVGQDGLLRIIDYRTERLQDVFGSYYGRIQCVAWSPDGQYILTGGQDDLVSIWSFPEKKIVARCQGHKSWVTGVAFDPWRCDDKVIRFGSVGDDCKLILWDFSYSALHRPKHKTRGISSSAQSPISPRSPNGTEHSNGERHHAFRDNVHPLSLPPPAPSTGSPSPFSRFRKGSLRSAGLFSNSAPQERFESLDIPRHVPLPTLHPVASKTQVPFLQPTTVQMVHADPCTDIIFREDCIVTADRRGRVRTWGRP